MKIIHEKLSGEVIGVAIDVFNALRPGLNEKLYERAIIELRSRGHVVDVQRSYPVYYQHQLIGTLVPDLIVDEKVITDAKTVSAFNGTHIAQMIGYLAITNLMLGLLLNFKLARLTWRRIVWQQSSE